MRLLTAIYVGVSGWIIYLALRRDTGTTVGITTGVLWVVAASRFCTVLTEEITMLPVAFCIYCLFRGTFTLKNAFWLGMCVAAASLVRTNLAFLLPFSVLAAYVCQEKTSEKLWRYALMVGVGFAVPHLSVFALYAVLGHFWLIWHTQITVPLAYPNYGAQQFDKSLQWVLGDPRSLFMELFGLAGYAKTSWYGRLMFMAYPLALVCLVQAKPR